MQELSRNFIQSFIDEDIAPGGRFYGKTVHTRLPPEPNGYPHIGHAMAFSLSMGIADEYGGLCNLRFDDTNPDKEEEEFVDAICDDIRWLGLDWGDRLFFGSDYFSKTYELAVGLIKKGLAYICELSPEEFKQKRGDIGVPAISPYRDRPIEESLDLFERMRNRQFPEGAMTLRAKIDLASGNFNMRDPVLYRIKYAHHHRQGDKWCIYPMYDFAHPIQDALEDITHSLCSLEYEDHRPLYDWVIENTDVQTSPRQIEFGRRSLDYTVMSKRKLRRLVEENYVDGWDDPRMPTIRGLRRRGYTSASIRDFCRRIGVGKTSNSIEYSLLEHCLREELNMTAQRAMAVLRPIELIIENFPAGKTEIFSAPNNPNDEKAGTREIAFSGRVWIDADDFMIEPPNKYNRLYVGNEVRLMNAYIVKCTGFELDSAGNVSRVRATYDPQTQGGNTPDGRKVRGSIHWVNADTAVDIEVRLYDQLFTDPNPDAPGCDFTQFINPNSLEVLTDCKAEKMIEGAAAGQAFQFLRHGYFTPDSKFSKPGSLIFNRTAGLKDSFKTAK
ncbi:MAG: glutamine--tRNA ligase/YqeY domain fusion protein [Oscillospiraceae bacterium]|nr:glutamine--tRNA ligase/YqeY domain fusion protein [Oscillospiraceae bacterium]